MSRFKYQVFLSFRGEDTRDSFTDHLYTALEHVGIHTFRDDNSIERGKHIDLEIQKSINESEASILVISKGYASSIWCLEELLMILDRKTNFGHKVLPVFYRVDPTHVSEQKGSFAEAFDAHEKEFKGEGDRVDRWRAALRVVAGLGGMVLQNGYEAKFIRDIVNIVNKLLNPAPLDVPSYVVGLDSYLESITSWLQAASDDVRIGMVYGISGVGKTTIAKCVYNQNFNNFECASFVSEVGEMLDEPNGLVLVQSRLLRDILKGTPTKIKTIDEGVTELRNAVCRRRVLIVLDDIDKLTHFRAMILLQDWLYQGSKIIVTTTQESLIRAHGTVMEFKVEPLNEIDSLKLFSWHAFGQAHPVEDKVNHSISSVKYCCGLPLAIELLASLHKENTEAWESALLKLEGISSCKIQNILRISYDSIDKEEYRSLFLDIACFFVGMNSYSLFKVLEMTGVTHVDLGVKYLCDRCLISIGGKLQMHQLLSDMAIGIVAQESINDRKKRSEMWGAEVQPRLAMRRMETRIKQFSDRQLLDVTKYTSSIEAFNENNTEAGDSGLQKFNTESGLYHTLKNKWNWCKEQWKIWRTCGRKRGKRTGIESK